MNSVKMPAMLYIPLDERPCNAVFPEYLAKIAGMPMLRPDFKILGDKKTPANVTAVQDWLVANADKADYAVISMDTLTYGGICPSRLHHLTAEECDRSFQALRKAKQINPNLRIYAFGLITRCPAYSSAEEEPDYYADYGLEINTYGVLLDKENLGVITPEEAEEKKALLAKIPAEILADFENRRKINFANNEKTIAYREEGIIDYLVFPMDDCKKYGYAPAERRALSACVGRTDLLSEIMLYPGADELGCIMTGRVVCKALGVSPAFMPVYSSATGSLTLPNYEDRSIIETMPYHIIAAGGDLAIGDMKPDVYLMVNAPTEFTNTHEACGCGELLFDSQRNLHAFVNKIKSLVKQDTVVAVADSSIANGADELLMRMLREENLLEKIDCYSGWNTSSNAAGTIIGESAVLAALKLAGLEPDRDTARRFLFLRLLEDWGYMRNIRAEMTRYYKDFGPEINYFCTGSKETEAKICVKLREMLKEWAAKNLPMFDYDYTVTTPWRRFFEIGIDIK